MVFSNIQAYLDPSNWQQQLNHQIGIGGTTSGNPQLPAPAQPQAPPLPHHGMGGLGSPGSIRPNSMSDRARMANIPMPEVALKCPRCESTNTKFCYFNNYSLSQPRHFCKTCRRYWTRGGALRSVPVGGGCRRNKRSKAGGSSSKSPVSGGGGDRQNSSSSTSSVSLTSTSAHPGGSILGMTPQMHLPPLRFMSPLSQLTQFSHGEIGLNYGGMSAPSAVTSDQMNFQTMNSQLGGGYVAEQWRMQAAQISSLAGLDLASNLYPFQGINLEATNYVNEGGLIRQKNMISSGLSTQMASVKMEDNNNNNNNNQEMTLPRQFLGMQGNDHHQYWGANTSTANWTDLSGFSSSSTTNPL